MIQSRDELIMEMAEEYGLNRMGENDEDEDDGDEGNALVWMSGFQKIGVMVKIDSSSLSH
jgi:hypothetical protein